VLAGVATATMLASLVGCAGGDSAPRDAPAPSAEANRVTAQPAALAPSLRRGGYVIYFRHAATDFSMSDREGASLSDCSRQRNLDARGRAQARAIGRAIRALALPIGRVLASRFCRTRDTARLAFGRVTLTSDLTSLPQAGSERERQRRIRALRRLLSRAPAVGRNDVLVAHLFNIQAAANVQLQEGEAAIFRPLGRRGFRLVRRVKADGWARLLAAAPQRLTVREFRVPSGSHPHDVAPARDGTVWYTGQHTGELGRLDPRTGRIRRVRLGSGSAPHGVIVGPDGAAWVTDSGLNAIVRVDARTHRVRRFPLPGSGYANLNTATFDRRGALWFTGQSGVYGRVDPRSGRVRVFSAPRGAGPYGITTTPAGDVYYASLAGSHIARIDTRTGRATVLQPPTRGQGARRVWSDSRGRIWVSEWNVGKVGMYDPRRRSWREWRLPGSNPQPYAIFVDDRDIVWLTDFGGNAIVRFEPRSGRFRVVRLPTPGAAVRQLLGRRGEVWGAESAADKLVVVRAG
jgi:virginiamycin B lyase